MLLRDETWNGVQIGVGSISESSVQEGGGAKWWFDDDFRLCDVRLIYICCDI